VFEKAIKLSLSAQRRATLAPRLKVLMANKGLASDRRNSWGLHQGRLPDARWRHAADANRYFFDTNKSSGGVVHGEGRRADRVATLLWPRDFGTENRDAACENLGARGIDVF